MVFASKLWSLLLTDFTNYIMSGTIIVDNIEVLHRMPTTWCEQKTDIEFRCGENKVNKKLAAFVKWFIITKEFTRRQLCLSNTFK